MLAYSYLQIMFYNGLIIKGLFFFVFLLYVHWIHILLGRGVIQKRPVMGGGAIKTTISDLSIKHRKNGVHKMQEK